MSLSPRFLVLLLILLCHFVCVTYAFIVTSVRLMNVSRCAKTRLKWQIRASQIADMRLNSYKFKFL